ncbi:MAG: ParA family protein [Spirochaetaceae bacterium]|nr:ParA family protein [Spirochaetaceae bacterium]
MIIAIANQKGGQGKTTTAQALATGCKGKVLTIDADPQANLTFSMGGNSADVGLYELITGQTTAGRSVQHLKQGDLIAASSSLALADTEFTGKQRTDAIKAAIKPLRDKYDHIIIDCPPTLNTLLINAIEAADVIIIPLTADMYSLQGLYQLAQTIKDRQKSNTGLKIGGVLFVKHNTRTILARDLTDVIKGKCAELQIPVYKTTIREGVAIREAQTQRESIFDYAPRSNPAKDYKQLIKEIGL